MDSATIVETSEAFFERDVLERSRQVPVVVDFWAEWCGPCRALGPLLERLAVEGGGAWLLAKVDVDANPALAAAFGIQGIPAVRAFKDGRQVAEFTGALPEPQVRRWLEQLGPSPADVAFERGRAAEERDDEAAAAAAYREALGHDPAHPGARRALARVELRARAAGVDEDALRQRLAAESKDVDAGTALADLEAARGDAEAAFSRLVELVRTTTGDDRERARKHLLTLLETLPPDDRRTLAARKSLAAALY